MIAGRMRLIRIPTDATPQYPNPSWLFRARNIAPVVHRPQNSTVGYHLSDATESNIQSMIEIRHKLTRDVLHVVEADTLKHARFFEAQLDGADFRDCKLSGADFTLASLSDSDFSGADCLQANFYSSHLTRANLRGAELSRTDCDDTDFRGCDLRSTDLFGAWLHHARLSQADMTSAKLSKAYLARAVLQNTNLRDVNLTEAVFQEAHLIGANLTGAILSSTIFSNCPTLHKAEGLTEIKHLGPSSLDRETLRACAAHLPDVFLLGVGYAADELAALRAMYPPISLKHIVYRELTADLILAPVIAAEFAPPD